MTRQKIKNLIEKTIKNLQKEKVLPKFDISKITVEHSEKKEHGDYATNIALIMFRILKKDPMEIANIISSRLKAQNSKLFERIEVIKPGFINFFLSTRFLQEQVSEILKAGKKFGQLDIGKKQKTSIESISANPTGPLHIGNGRNAFSGDALANVLEKAGYKVTREYFVNDAKINTQIKLLGKTGVGEGTVYLTDYLRSKIQNSKFKIQNYKSKFKDKEKLYGEAGFLLAQQIQKDTRDFIEKKLKIKFDNWISEQELYKKNKIKKIFDWLKRKNLVYEKDKAWWIKTSEFGDEKDWVIIRETGEPTYLLSDIAYHKDKFDRGFKKIVNIWGADHLAHVSKIKAAAKMLGYKGILDILILQLVTLKGKERISKRRGKVVTLEDLVDEIGLDVARFFYLQKSLDTHMEIDLALAKERSEKNPVYYVQYAHARICSILKKLKARSKKQKAKAKSQKLKLLKHPSELSLIKELIKFPEVVEDTAKDYQIQRLPQYAVDLATVFHQFYRDCRVISEDKALTQARLALVLVTKIVLKNTLDLMGISAPERM